MHFKFPFNLIGKFTMGEGGGAFFNRTIMLHTQIGAQRKDLCTVSQTGLTRNCPSSVAKASLS